MAPTIELTEADIRAAVERYGEVIPGVSNERVINNAIAALKGELVMKDAHGISDDALEAIYSIAYNEFQAGKFDAAHTLFVFLCMFDHLNKKYWMALGACRFSNQDYIGAGGAYVAAGLIDDCDPTPPLRAADCYLAGGDIETAIEALKHGVKLCGDDPKHAESKKRAQSVQQILEEHTLKAA